MVGWRSKGLEECLEKVKYPSKIHRKKFLAEGPFPIVSQEKDFINGFWDGEQDVFQVKKPVVIFGDHTKVLKYVDFDFVLGADGVKILQPKDFLYPKFFYYFLSAFPVKALGYARHYRLLKELKVHYPESLPEQKRIVAILDEAFAGIDAAVANTEKNLANARELFESYLNAVFTQKGDGWVEKPLSSFMNIYHGFAFKGPDFKVSSDESKPIVLTPGNYSEHGGLYFTEKNTKRFTGELPKKYLFEVGELTVVMTDLSSKMKILGKPAFINQRNILHNQRIGRITFKNTEVLPRLVYYYLCCLTASEHIKKTSTGTMVRHTAPKRILALNMAFPSSEERQAKIVSVLDDLGAEVKNLEAIYQQKLESLAELKQSILQKAFAGELTTLPVKEIDETVA